MQEWFVTWHTYPRNDSHPRLDPCLALILRVRAPSRAQRAQLGQEEAVAAAAAARRPPAAAHMRPAQPAKKDAEGEGEGEGKGEGGGADTDAAAAAAAATASS